MCYNEQNESRNDAKSTASTASITEYHTAWFEMDKVTSKVTEGHLQLIIYNYGQHTRLTALFPGLPGWAGTRKVKPVWILLKQETVSGSGISWAICKSASRSRQITMPVPHHSIFYRPDALPATQPIASKHWRQTMVNNKK